MNRRNFAKVGCAAAWTLGVHAQTRATPGGGTVRQEWLDRRKEPILEPSLPIIDPHHHLFIRPWAHYMSDELLKDLSSGHNVIGTVHVQCRTMYRKDGPVEMQPVGETEFVNGVAAMFASGIFGESRACAGIVGQANLMLGSRVEPVLAAHLRAGGDRFRGINHTGTPLGIGAYRGRRDEVFSRWSASMKALAAHPNVFVKLGGLGMRYIGLDYGTQAEPPSSEVLATAYRPFVETCIKAFGVSRVMFESNFPVDKVSYSYPVFWNACKLLTKGMSASEKRELFAGTADRFYRLHMLGRTQA
ncbi:MAG: amidohydrolase family protein [Bryobacteraceae bacterium]